LRSDADWWKMTSAYTGEILDQSDLKEIQIWTERRFSRPGVVE